MKSVSKQLMELESFRQGLLNAMVTDLSNNFSYTSPIDDKDIENAGFKKVKTPVFVVNDVSYVCPRRKAINFTKKDEFYSGDYKQRIFDAIKKIGFTHILKVSFVECPFWFGGKDYKLEDAVCVMVDGATIKE